MRTWPRQEVAAGSVESGRCRPVLHAPCDALVIVQCNTELVAMKQGWKIVTGTVELAGWVEQ